MLYRLSKNIAQFFCDKNLIPHDEIESYAYGYEILLMNAVNWGIILGIMLATGNYLETIFYITVIITMRHHTGGYHAKTHLSCGIISVLSYACVLLISAYLPTLFAFGFDLTAIIIAFFIVAKWAPVEHENNPVSNALVKKHRRYSLVLLCLFSSVATAFLCICHYSLATSISLALFQVGISILPEIHKYSQEGGETK